MKWYETYNPFTGTRKWWTQRDSRGVCFEIRQIGKRFDLYTCDAFTRSFETLQAAMDAAAEL